MNWCFQLWCWRTLLRVPWTGRRSNQSILKEINPEHSLKGPMLKLKLQYSGHLMQRADSSRKTPCCWESLKAGGEGAAEDEIVRWHHRLNGHELEETPGNSEEQGCQACCCPGVQGVANSGTQLSDWTTTFTIFFPLPSDIFQAILQFHLPKTVYLFEQETVSGVSYNLSGNWKFSIKRILEGLK